MVINDFRRKHSEQYQKFFLTNGYFYAELPSKNPLAQLEFLTMEDLKNTPIILIAPHHQENIEELFFVEYFDVQSEFIFVETIEEAHLQVVSNRGYFLSEFNQPPEISNGVKYIPLIRDGKQLFRKYGAFWRNDNDKNYIREFAEMLRSYFPEKAEPISENF